MRHPKVIFAGISGPYQKPSGVPQLIGMWNEHSSHPSAYPYFRADIAEEAFDALRSALHILTKFDDRMSQIRTVGEDEEYQAVLDTVSEALEKVDGK